MTVFPQGPSGTPSSGCAAAADHHAAAGRAGVVCIYLIHWSCHAMDQVAAPYGREQKRMLFHGTAARVYNIAPADADADEISRGR
jgi:hypothetical protein